MGNQSSLCRSITCIVLTSSHTTVYRPVSHLLSGFTTEYLSNYGLDITVVYMDLSDEGVDGWCMREDDNEFLIQIEEKLEGAEHTKTVLHELYHVFQHLHNIPRCEMCARMSEQFNLDRFKKTL